MNTRQERDAGLPTRRDLTQIYALSFVIATLMVVASVAGLLYRHHPRLQPSMTQTYILVG